MKKTNVLATLFVLLLQPLTAKAGFSADFDLKLNASFDTFGRRWNNTGTIKCNPLGQGSNEDFWAQQRYLAEQSTGAVTLTTTGVRNFETKAQYNGQSVYTPRHVKINFETKNESESAKLSINEDTELNANSQPKGNCSDAEYSAKTAAFLTSGSVVLKYKVPKNVWVIKLTAERTGDFLLAQTSENLVEGALHISPSLQDNMHIVWVKPESEIFIKVDFKDYTLARALSGGLTIKVDFPKKSISKLADLSEVTYQLSTNQALQAIESLAALLNSNALESREFIRETKTSQVLVTLDALYAIASTAGHNDYEWDTKASAALVAYQLAKNILSDIAPYCTTLRFKAPLEPNRIIEVTGAHYTWYFLSKAIYNLKSPTYTRLMPVINRLLEHEKAGLTYKNIFDDNAEFDRLRSAWSATSKIHASMEPFRSAAVQVKSVLDNVQIDSTTSDNLKSIVQDLFKLSETADKLESDLNDRLDLLRTGSPTPILISDIVTRLDRIFEAQDTYAHKLSMAVSLMNMAGTNEPNIKAVVTKLISQNIDILNRPFPGTDFEKLRADYVGLNKSQDVVNSALKCLEKR